MAAQDDSDAKTDQLQIWNKERDCYVYQDGSPVLLEHCASSQRHLTQASDPADTVQHDLSPPRFRDARPVQTFADTSSHQSPAHCASYAYPSPTPNGLDEQRVSRKETPYEVREQTAQKQETESVSTVQIQHSRHGSGGGTTDKYQSRNRVRIGGTATNARETVLPPTFKKRGQPQKYFTVGKVFLTLWAEPAHGDKSTITTGISRGEFGEPVFSKVRRFIVLRSGEQHCTAIPILTYGGHGVAKYGVVKSEHAIVYSGKKVPSPTKAEAAVRGEDALLPHAVRINLDNNDNKLDSMSRLNLGKLYTIEHNVKVCSYGYVHPASMPTLLTQFRSIWGATLGYQRAEVLPSVSSSVSAPNTPADVHTRILAYRVLRESTELTDEQLRLVRKVLIPGDWSDPESAPVQESCGSLNTAPQTKGKERSLEGRLHANAG